MYSKKLTKIIATLGPASDSADTIEDFIKEGVNVFRFNMKHNTSDWHVERINRVQKIADKLKANIGIMIDLQGPEIRINTPNKAGLQVEPQDQIVFTSSEPKSGKKEIQIPQLVVNELIAGVDFSIDDGFHNFCVLKRIDKNSVLTEVRDAGFIGDKKSLNLVGIDVPLPSLIEADLEKLNIACKSKVDFIALSFVRSAKDIKILRKEMAKLKVNADIVAKIESQKGIDNIEEIINETDAVMIARGDLGIETPIEMLAYYQKELIRKCRQKAKPVITATQMLQSLTVNPIPTRAEAADVANAIYDGTDAIMLSGETASGKYPLKAVKYMASIALFNEEHACNINTYQPESTDQTHAVVRASLDIIKKDSGVNIDRVVIFSDTGYTGKVFSSYRSKTPILVVSNSQKSVEKLTMSFGIQAIKIDYPTKQAFDHEDLIADLKKLKRVHKNETLLLLHGAKWNEPGKTNSVEIKKVY